jgi:hypothetical protein
VLAIPFMPETLGALMSATNELMDATGDKLWEMLKAHIGFWGDELIGLSAAERVAVLNVTKAVVTG